MSEFSRPKLPLAERWKARRLFSMPARFPEEEGYGDHYFDPVIQFDLDDAMDFQERIEDIFNPGGQETDKPHHVAEKLTVVLGSLSVIGFCGEIYVPQMVHQLAEGLRSLSNLG